MLIHIGALLLTVFAIFIALSEAGYCNAGYSCTCSHSERYYKKCGLFGWARCARYRTVYDTCTCYKLQCCAGYEGSNCATPKCTNGCPYGGTCIRPDECSCRTGYLSPSCKDINECTSNNGGCKQSCTNTIGSFSCSCDNGYYLGNDGKTCYDINECTSNNGGCKQSCTNTIGSFYCSCDNGYYLGNDGKTCYACTPSPTDLVFVVDDSTSVQPGNYVKVKELVVDIVENLNIAPNDTLVSYLSFSNTVQIQFYLDDYSVKASLIKKINSIRFRGGGTDIRKALTEAYDENFQSVNGARDNVAKILFLITDGSSPSTETISATIRDAGITILSLGIGSITDTDMLISISGDTNLVYEAANFDALPALVDQLFTAICEAISEQYRFNNIYSKDDSSTTTSTTSTLKTGFTQVIQTPTKASQSNNNTIEDNSTLIAAVIGAISFCIVFTILVVITIMYCKRKRGSMSIEGSQSISFSTINLGDNPGMQQNQAYESLNDVQQHQTLYDTIVVSQDTINDNTTPNLNYENMKVDIICQEESVNTYESYNNLDRHNASSVEGFEKVVSVDTDTIEYENTMVDATCVEENIDK